MSETTVSPGASSPCVEAALPNRRSIFVGLAALGASAAVPAIAAEAPADLPRLTIGNTADPPISRVHPNFVKNVGLLTDLNPTNQGGAWWNFDTYITPAEQFYIRNEYPTPRAEIDARVDPPPMAPEDPWRRSRAAD